MLHHAHARLRKITRLAFALGAALLAASLVAGPARAQIPMPFALVKDFGAATPTGSIIDSTYTSGPTAFQNAQVIGPLAFFAANTPEDGIELWRSDGTEAGTYKIKDICPGSGGSLYPSDQLHIASIGGTAYFVADDCASSNELWKSDGTSSGTQRVKDIAPGTIGSNISNMVVVDSTLFFKAFDGSSTTIWRSNGTANGTVSTKLQSTPLFGLGGGLIFRNDSGSECQLQRLDVASGAVSMLASICPNSELTSNTSAIGTQLAYFTANSPDTGIELWRTDGSAQGTLLVKDIQAGSASSYPYQFSITPQDRLFFIADDGTHGSEFWTSDGTADGTFLLKDIIAGSGTPNPGHPVVTAQGRLFFRANDGVHGVELWTSDGTADGTKLVKDIYPGTADGALDSLVTWHNRAFFNARDTSYSNQLWSSDGTEQGTALVTDLIPGAKITGSLSEITTATSALFFLTYDSVNGFALYQSDGTGSGTTLIKNLDVNKARALHAFKQGVIFLGSDSTHGNEPWISDGTEAGTHLLKNIAADGTPSSQPILPRVLNSHLLYFGQNTDGSSDEGYALYRSDGSADSTQLLKTFYQAPYAENDAQRAPVLFGGALYFPATGTYADSRTIGEELWRSDGTADGTALFDDIAPGQSGSEPSYLTTSGNTLYFQATTDDTGTELWKTQGTPASTVLVKDISSGSTSSYPSLLTADDAGGVYFAASDGTSGYELWHSDGTAQGTHMVRDLAPGSGGNDFGGLTMVGTTLYFGAYNESGTGLWATDGTESGTRQISDVSISSAITVSGKRLFFMAWNEASGYELWSSDGTAKGTAMAKDIDPGPGSSLSFSQDMVLLNGALYFAATDSAGTRTLWKSDGTASGTARVVSGSGAPVNPESLRVIDGRLYFSAADSTGASGRELWVSDGTAASTRLFQDVNPGAASSSPYNMIKVGQRFYLAAYKPGAGVELWSATPQHEVFLPLTRR